MRVEATPINPSDLGLLLGPADMATAKASGTAATAGDHGQGAASRRCPCMAARLDQSMPVGNEGAGTVIKAGSSEAAQALLGKTVSMIGGAMYAQYRLLEGRPTASRCRPARRRPTARRGSSIR